MGFKEKKSDEKWKKTSDVNNDSNFDAQSESALCTFRRDNMMY